MHRAIGTHCTHITYIHYVSSFGFGATMLFHIFVGVCCCCWCSGAKYNTQLHARYVSCKKCERASISSSVVGVLECSKPLRQSRNQRNSYAYGLRTTNVHTNTQIHTFNCTTRMLYQSQDRKPNTPTETSVENEKSSESE